MPYVITTRHNRAETAPLTFPSRRAVATLEERRAALIDLLETHKPRINSASTFRALVDCVIDLPESGGTITLPDGTEIKVEPCPYSSLAGFAGLTIDSMPTDAQIIDAYNAAQVA
jgi:hypothetical protein